MPTSIFPRISARKGSVVRLNVSFFANGQAADPFAIRRIDIYQNSKKDENLVMQIDLVDPDNPLYPAPLVNVGDTAGNIGEFYYDLTVPDDFASPDSYIDEWHFIGDELLLSGGTSVDLTDESLWDSQCNEFFIVAASSWYIDDELIVPRFGFEALDKSFSKPEVRTLEVGIMPLPLYDYNFNQIAPLIPQITATIRIETMNCEEILAAGAMTIGFRQGTHRSNPYVVRYRLDTSTFQAGSYRYWITLNLPNGETRISKALTISIGR